MGLFTENPDRSGLTAAVGKIADGFSRLVTHHLALARMELADDARAIGADLGRIAAFVPFVLVGYALLCGAIGVFLGQWIGMAGGLAVVGGANVIGGGVGIWRAIDRLRTRRMMDGTIQELDRSTDVLNPPNGKQVMEIRDGQ